MSGRPDKAPISSSPSNSNGGAGIPAGGVPPRPDINPPHPHGLPTATVPHLPLVTTSGTSQQAQAGKIPPLMGITPNVPPAVIQSAQLPTPATSQPSLSAVPQPSGNTVPLIPPSGTHQLAAPGGTSPPKLPMEGKGPQSIVNQGALKPRSAAGGGKQFKDKGDGDKNGVPQKVPILRLKKTGEDDDSFEKQDVSKNDSYCWVCHDGGDVLCCDKCPRVFHLQCSGLQKPPEEEEDNEWFCSICKNIARKTKRSRPQNLSELLLLAVERMMFPGTEIFQSPVPPDIMTHYREYVFFPMHLGKIREKVSAGKYQSTREFTHDTEWILHNCIIYNGAKHALTKIAKNIVKVCKEDMREIELCPGCYKLTVKQPKDWFCVPCNPPHPVVLAKVRGYPLWPAKLISETSDKCDVRFFGQHDRSLVPKCDIQVLNGLPPKPSTKTKHWNQAMFELKRYGENIESMRDKLGVKDKSLKVLMLKNKAGQASPQKSSNSQSSPQKEDSSQGSNLSQANHSPYPPPVVEVTPADGPDGAGSLSDTEISSPGTPPSLQIDLKEPGHSSQDRTPIKGRAMPSGSGHRMGAISRNSQIPGSLDFNSDSGAQSVVVRSPSTNSSSKMIKKKNMRAGAALSALVSTLQRKRVAEQVCALTPVHQGAVLSMPSGGQEEAAETGKTKPAEEPPAEEKTSSPFSSMYEQSRKTAFAIVDPDQKRVKRKTAKAVNETPTPPPAKRARTGNSAAVTTNEASKGDGDPVSISDPAAFAAKVQEFSNAAISALNTATVSSSSSGSHPVASLKAGTTAAVRTSVSTSPNSSVASNNSGSGATLNLPGLPKSRAPSGGGKKKGGKKAVDKNRRGKSPHIKGGNKTANTTSSTPSTTTVSSALAALISAPANSTPPPTTSESAATTRANFMSQVSQGTVSTPSAPTEEVRGEAAAPGIGGDEISDFAEGTGLLADTIRKVNTSFMARVNQMTGPSDDMGYKYFEEKLMASIKTVLMEMLSTFDAKSRMSAKQLREQLHQGWPVSNSSVAMEQLGKELRDEMKQSLEVVRASAALELEQVVNEVRRQVEKEKEIAILETKKKKWCSYCMKEAQYNCCWNANYCNEICQQSHWPEHMDSCTQVQQQAPPRTPSSQVTADTPLQKTAQSQLSPTLGNMRNIPNGVGSGTGAGMSNQQDSQQGFMFPSAAQVQSQAQAQSQAFAAQAQAQAQAQAIQAQAQMLSQAHMQQGGGAGGSGQQQPPGRMSPMGNATSQQQQGSLSGAGGTLPHSIHPSHQQQQQQHLRSAGGLRHDQHHNQMHVDGIHQLDSITTPTPTEKSASHIDQLPSDGIISTANTASPPNHIRNMLLSQHHQQSSKGGGVITGSNPIMMGHQSPAPPSHVHTPSMGGEMHPALSSRNEHSNSGGMLHPVSPATPPSDNPSSVHTYGGWAYPHPQHPVLIGNDSFAHGLPLLPTVQANTPTTQNHTFFKANNY